jgi:hypothetical protein
MVENFPNLARLFVTLMPGFFSKQRHSLDHWIVKSEEVKIRLRIGKD